MGRAYDLDAILAHVYGALRRLGIRFPKMWISLIDIDAVLLPDWLQATAEAATWADDERLGELIAQIDSRGGS